MDMEIYWAPCAQSTITRPMAEAISLARGGMPVQYFDTQCRKEKEVNAYDLHMLNLDEVKVDGKESPMRGDEAAILARHADKVCVKLQINDVIVEISKETTIDEAVKQYKDKLLLRYRHEQLTAKR